MEIAETCTWNWNDTENDMESIDNRRIIQDEEFLILLSDWTSWKQVEIVYILQGVINKGVKFVMQYKAIRFSNKLSVYLIQKVVRWIRIKSCFLESLNVPYCWFSLSRK